MPTKLNKLAVVALARVRLVESKIKALHYACKDVRSLQRETSGIEKEFATLHAALYRELNDAYSNLFMWGIVIGKDVEKEALKIISEKFTAESVSVMHYLQLDGSYPSSYSSSIEEELRADIAKALLDKGVNPVVLQAACVTCNASKGVSCRNKLLKRCPPHAKRRVAVLVKAVKSP